MSASLDAPGRGVGLASIEEKPTVRRKSASPVHASAAAIRASPERPRKGSRSSVKSKAASMPRARSAAATISMRPRACPSRSPCAWSRSTRSATRAASRTARPSARAAGTAARAEWRWARRPSTPHAVSVTPSRNSTAGLRTGQSRSPAGGTTRSRESLPPGPPPARAAAHRHAAARGPRTRACPRVPVL